LSLGALHDIEHKFPDFVAPSDECAQAAKRLNCKIHRSIEFENLVMNCSNCGIQSEELHHFENCTTGIQNLDLSENGIEFLSYLPNMVDLKDLHLEHNRIVHLNNIPPIIQLEQLFLNANRINDLTGISSFVPNILNLNLADNRITSVTPLTPLLKLMKLNLERNSIISAVGLPLRGYMQRLNLNQNKITSPKGIPPNVRTLDHSFNNITSLVELGRLKNLMWLNLSHNEISSLKGFNTGSCFFLFRSQSKQN